jgi:hypothetical protein
MTTDPKRLDLGAVHGFLKGSYWAREVAFPGDGGRPGSRSTPTPKVGIEPDGSDLSRIHAAKDIFMGARCNAAFMLAEGRPTEEAVRYLTRWALMDEEPARRAIPSLRRPFAEAYVFCYHHGRKLLEPGMGGPGRDGFVRGLLTEQTLPSDLRRRWESAPSEGLMLEGLEVGEERLLQGHRAG